ncbi:uncharacterized protein [Dysidea avara]|uniref:uncharacterized protein n=1 Tax=Dysidea avara TaxID=196820 RepID=UPI00331BECBA
MPYVFRLSDLPKLDLQVDRGTDFEAWKAQWTSYSTLEEDRNNAEAVIAAIKRHVDGHINESMERRRLRRRVQQPGESFDDYLSIHDQIIEGLVDGDTIEQLLRQQNLTLDTTITMCRAQEAAKTQRKDVTDHSVLAIRQSAKPQVRQVPPHTSQMIPKPCQGCGLQAHQGGRAQGPVFKQTCHYCLKVGHFARVCHGRQQHKKPPAARAIATAEDPDQESNEISPGLSTISL